MKNNIGFNTLEDTLLHHYTDDYLASYNLKDIENSIVLVQDCTECQASLNNLKSSRGNRTGTHLEHLDLHLETYKKHYSQLDTILHRDNTLSDTVKGDLIARKQAIVNFLLTNETCLRTKVALENKIVQIDSNLSRSNGKNASFKSRVLSLMETLKREMFILDDAIVCHAR